jgi:N-methylhydantoinase A/oxoprolinase/acetone carboxylase beta subunit
VIEGVARGLEEAAAVHFPGARPFVTQNDGTLMSPAVARRLPVLTIGSGPSNSLRGAAALTGLRDALVVDVGGTSTDVGALVRGFPRESSVGVEIGGVTTNFRMPDVVSIALGGGTVVDADGSLGIESVGRRLTQEALVFGGRTPTGTDAAVAAGRASIGDPALVRDREDLAAVLAQAQARAVDAIDRMRVTAEPVDLVLVGGGIALLDDTIDGARRVHRPHDADVANAVGAALAPVSGEADLVADVGPGRRDDAIAEVIALARARAVAAGADPTTIETVWVDEVPLAYLDRPLSRLRAKVAGSPAGAGAA